MLRRRPPREGHVNNFIIFAAVVLFLTALVDAQQQQRPAVQQRHESPHEGLDHESSHTLDVTKIPPVVETPRSHERRKNTYVVNNKQQKFVQHDVSAIATLAPATPAVVAPVLRRPSFTTGLPSPQIARSLEDWEVEDFVLLATVDGKLHARDRKTGKERWQLGFQKSMVESKYHRRSQSSDSTVEENYDPISIDDYIWIVEPSRDGSLYVYRPSGPNPGLVNTNLTMKKLVEEMSPYANEDPPVVYTGKKQTVLMTVDANTGQVISYFGTEGALKMSDEKCIASPAQANECPKTATLTIGRTDYTVAIQGKGDGHHIATLTFSEWSPNNYDLDLQRQYRTTLDNKYIYTSHDGSVIGLDHDQENNEEEKQPLFQHKFSSPVVRVFDVARPWGPDNGDQALIILPQPSPPPQTFQDSLSADSLASSIFLNHTEDGSWYALSGKSYPMAVQGPRRAEISQHGSFQLRNQWDVMNAEQLSEALVGLHNIDETQGQNLLTINAPSFEDNQTGLDFAETAPLALLGDLTIGQMFREAVGYFILQVSMLLQNIALWGTIGVLIGVNQRKIRTWIGHLGHEKGIDMGPIFDIPQPIAMPSVEKAPELSESQIVEITTTKGPVDSPADKLAVKIEELETRQPEVVVVSETDVGKLEIADQEKDAGSPEKPEKEKKKAHRGRRGGKKHQKGARATSTDPESLPVDGTATPRPARTVEDAVTAARNMGPLTKKLEPDIRTIPGNPDQVSGPLIRIGALEVNTDKRIGTGSNGTVVYEGKFDGRPVAVKRMLIQFFDIASQETKLLRESDDHPNVIRYFAQEQADDFLYIALELCPASLAEVIDKPGNHRELARAGEQDLPNVLFQITNGLSHLHSLRIVHRDLKPQNVLVSMGKDGRPRLLVSDFGLCKKLDNDVSSFGATTAHAAGTTGWRAPELLLDDDAHHSNHGAMVDASTDGNSGSHAIGADLSPGRRATRAIDIFSLGLVFHYVLTRGRHPFDCGDKFMREVNIRQGKYDLKHLEVLGDFAEEAKELIGSMLASEPKKRPTALQVMAHPFFWSAKKRLNFLCDVSDHFEKEKRDPPTEALQVLEDYSSEVVKEDFLKHLGKDFVESMGKQRKYTGTRLLDLLRALRNKKNHYEDMSDKLKRDVGPLPDGYLSYWTTKFPNLLLSCWNVVYEVQWDETDRFREYYIPSTN